MAKKTPLTFIPNYNHHSDWYHEGQVSSTIVKYLLGKGYRIQKDNSHNTRARGEDIIAISPTGIKEVIEVKGYPTEYYTMGDKKGQPKKTSPKLQATHWFSEVILSSVYNYLKHKNEGKFCLALGLPKMNRYSELKNKVEDFFTDHNIDIKLYLVDESRNITIENLNSLIKPS